MRDTPVCPCSHGVGPPRGNPASQSRLELLSPPDPAWHPSSGTQGALRQGLAANAGQPMTPLQASRQCTVPHGRLVPSPPRSWKGPWCGAWAGQGVLAGMGLCSVRQSQSHGQNSSLPTHPPPSLTENIVRPAMQSSVKTGTILGWSDASNEVSVRPAVGVGRQTGAGQAPATAQRLSPHLVPRDS